MKYSHFAKLFKWYLGIDYWPDSVNRKYSIFFNKSVYFILIFIALILISILNAFEKKINDKLFNPYFNSIAANCIGVSNFNEKNLRSSFSELNFDPIFLEVAYFNSYTTKKSSRLNGIAMEQNHPYFESLNRNGNLIWTSGYTPAKEKGIIFSLDGLSELGVKYDSIKSLSEFHVQMKKLRSLSLNETIPVYKVVKTLPDGKDFIILSKIKDYYIKSQIIKSREAAEKASFTILIQNLEKDIYIDSIIRDIEVFFTKRGENLYLAQSMEDANKIILDFDDSKYYLDELKNFLTIIDSESRIKYEVDFKLEVQSINFDEIIENEALEEFHNKWLYFSITPNKSVEEDIYIYIDSLYEFYPNLYIDTKSTDTVYFLKSINSIIIYFQVMMFIFLLFSSVILNYKILEFHLHQRRNHILFLNLSGVPKKIFYLVYIFEGFVETLIVFILSILVVQLLQIVVGNSIFLFSFDMKVVIFVSTIFISMIIIYLLSIRTLLKGNRRFNIE